MRFIKPWNYRMQQSDAMHCHCLLICIVEILLLTYFRNTLIYLSLCIGIVTTQRWRTVVLRRYSDFVALQDILLLRYPYRAIPRLPPKKVIVTEGADL